MIARIYNPCENKFKKNDHSYSDRFFVYECLVSKNETDLQYF